MPDEPGRDLLERFVRGDRDAFETLFRQFHGEAHRWILRIVRDRAAADDALIETFWRAYRSRARFDPQRPFGAWLRRIASRAAIDQLNRSRRDRWLAMNAVDHVPPHREAASRVGAAGTSGPAIAESIARAFDALPAKLRVVAALALIEDHPLAEIADALDVPLGTVKSRLFRATQTLRKELARLGVRT